MQMIAHIQMAEGGVLYCRMPEAGAPLQLGDPCLFELDYGLDAGSLAKVAERPPEMEPPGFCVLRKLTAEDAAQVEANEALAQKARQSFLLSVRYEKTPVKVLHVRFSFGRERLFIRYSAAVAVDLRRFVSQIQRDYKTQVDLWQVGARDEAAAVGCVGVCGRVACCCAWQHQPPNVNTRMAKVQDVPLNPVTANGRCGRLKCCLAYEAEQYRQEGQNLPEVGSTVRCLMVNSQDVCGVVVERNVMCGKLAVRMREGQTLKLLKEDVVLIHAARQDDQTKGDSHEDSVGEWSEP